MPQLIPASSDDLVGYKSIPNSCRKYNALAGGKLTQATSQRQGHALLGRLAGLRTGSLFNSWMQAPQQESCA